METVRVEGLQGVSVSGKEYNVVNPRGGGRLWRENARRIDTLEGKTICEIWNGLYRGPETFSMLRELIRKRFPTAKIIPYTEFPIGFPDTRTIGDVVKGKGCEAVIIGNAY